MSGKETVEELLRDIRDRVIAIEGRFHDPKEIADALNDVLATYAEIGQVREVLQRHDEALRELIAAMEEGKRERGDLHSLLDRSHSLMTQLRELSRKHVTGLTDLERAIYGGETRLERAQRERQTKKTPAE